MSSLDIARDAIRRTGAIDETDLVSTLIAACGLSEAERGAISAKAADLVETVRSTARPGLMESFLSEYGLATDEGVALMSLAEALLRVPDSETIDALIQDKVTGSHWEEHFGHSKSTFVNFSTWALSLTADVLGNNAIGPESALHAVIRRLGEPVIRVAVAQAMRMLGSQFVFGRTIDEAVTHAKGLEREGYRFSYDMLGEAARTAHDAARYLDAYAGAIAGLAPFGTSARVHDNPGISVKLSALHPRYEFAKRERVLDELVERTRILARAAKAGTMSFNIDAEEADRLDLSLDVIERVLADPELAGWDGFGVVVQAYGKRALPVIDWLDALAEKLDRRIMVRLVKGAYWDAEVKRAQVLGLAQYPVFTRKPSTDISYIAAARKLLGAKRIYPQFATHNAHTAAAVLHLAQSTGQSPKDFEFQRLHGMGETLHEVLHRHEGTNCRIYAPVGPHKELLAYLVRRLLENGANGSFVYQIADADIPAAKVAEDPIGKVLKFGNAIPNPAIPTPAQLFGASRANSTGFDLTDPVAVEALMAARAPFEKATWQAGPLIAGDAKGEAPVPVRNPAKPGDTVGTIANTTPAEIGSAIAAAKEASASWSSVAVAQRAASLRQAADLYERHHVELFALLAREAGKTLGDAVSEVREAVDFLRYYAAEAETHPDGAARGVITCISPWNFPLAIFTGQIAAALAAGNAVLAKPAAQTPLIAWRAVQLMHEAGIPADVLQFLPGEGASVGAALTSDARIDGVCFTGSLPTAKRIDRAMATHASPDAPLIAETGGLNAMIVDSTALPEQAVRDILASAFQSAGQRCSALRILYLQKDIADGVLAMLKGAMDELALGDPLTLATDVGPVIDEAARVKIEAHVAEHALAGNMVKRLPTPAEGTFVPPTIIRVSGIEALKEEIFGPVLHVATFKAEEIDQVIAAINASGYGLTFGMHTRLSSRVASVSEKIAAGNVYINRNQIGAVVGSQPFGGEGLSGTGPKAGGPAYLSRFRRQVASPLPPAREAMPGPTGESNELRIVPRGALLCLGPSEEDHRQQLEMARQAGCSPRNPAVEFAPGDLDSLSGFDAVAYFGEDSRLREVRQALAKREGAILPLLTHPGEIGRLVLERHVCIDTTAAGGNASLLAQSGAE